ncbi:MAG: LptF/LptG family permease [Thiotrichaceae bacterium]
MTALSDSLSSTNPRQGQYAKLFTGIMIGLIYNNLLSIAQKWIEKGDVPVWLGVCRVHGILLVIILALVYEPQFKMWWYFRKLRLNP